MYKTMDSLVGVHAHLNNETTSYNSVVALQLNHPPTGLWGRGLCYQPCMTFWLQ